MPWCVSKIVSSERGRNSEAAFMKTQLQHIQLNVGDRETGYSFYRDLFGYFEYQAVDADENLLGFTDGRMMFWVVPSEPRFSDRAFHRKAPGLNHIAFRVENRDDVDRFAAEFLAGRGITLLYDSPKEMPEYGGAYYAVYFEGPDRIKLEVMYS
jgi:catechol 2,3-dioxygenase-like lactoylglutathione lyase family enzyme